MRRKFKLVEVAAFDARRGYRRCSLLPGVLVYYGDELGAQADFWRDRTGRLFARFTSQGYVFHLEAMRANGKQLSDSDMTGFEMYVSELLNEWVIEGVDELPESCYDY